MKYFIGENKRTGSPSFFLRRTGKRYEFFCSCKECGPSGAWLNWREWQGGTIKQLERNYNFVEIRRKDECIEKAKSIITEIQQMRELFAEYFELNQTEWSKSN